MRFEHKIWYTKDGRECILFPTKPEYAQEMIDYLKITSAETPFLLRYPDEITYTVEAEKELLERFYKDSRTIMMLALVDGKVAGNCSVSEIGGLRRVRHRGSLAIALKKEFWGIGIGTAMIDFISELSQRAGYEQLELGVIEGNEQAKHLYEKCGFTEIGKMPNSLKYDDGTYKDEILMWKRL